MLKCVYYQWPLQWVHVGETVFVSSELAPALDQN